MGFSPLGLIVSLAVLAPSLLLACLPPSTPLPPAPAPAPALLRWLERTGQASSTVVPAITAPGDTAWWWAVPVVLSLAAYYALWARYLTTGREAAALYRPWRSVPVPMALLPVSALLASAAWLDDGWIALAALTLAAGHVPASVLAARAVAPRR